MSGCILLLENIIKYYYCLLLLICLVYYFFKSVYSSLVHSVVVKYSINESDLEIKVLESGERVERHRIPIA